jgi:signal transduction histidine kinase
VNGWRTQWWLRWRNSPARDWVSATAITVVLLLGSWGEARPNQPADLAQFHGHHLPHTPPAALLLVAAAGLVLAVKRRYPVTVLAVSTACVVAYSLPGNVNGAVLLAPAIALFTVAQLLPVRRALLVAALTLVVLMAATAQGNPLGPTGGGFFLIPALIAAAVFGGIAVANRRAYVASIQARAEELASRRVDEERLRIARELHDIVAHTMATISVQAGVASHVLGENPAAAGEALRAIRQSSKDGLRELRAILNVLRQADEDNPTQPAPGLAQLDALVTRTCQAGLPTTVSTDGQPGQLPPAVDLAAYRIVQESLTNVIKHAGPATAAIALRYDDTGLRIEVTDTGAGLPGGSAAGSVTEGSVSGGGHGIIGMRERAASVGGTLEAGPGQAGGYRVVAELPADTGTGGLQAQANGAQAGRADAVPARGTTPGPPRKEPS